MINVRAPIFPDAFGHDQDQDANSLLTELDKGMFY